MHKILNAIRAELWAMRPEVLATWMVAQISDPQQKAPRLPSTEGAIAVVPIQGVIGHRRGSGYYASVYSADLSAYLEQAAANPSVGAIVLDIDSPGGTVSGLAELSDTVNATKAVKPVYAVANPEAASAAYHVGSQATKFYASPSAEVGSIGVWAAHMDISKMLEDVGVNMTLISAGKYKVEGNPYAELSEDGRAEIQRSVDLHYDRFLGAVAKGRGTTKATVRDTFGEGRMIEADRAKDLGMIDGIYTAAEVIRGIAKQGRKDRMRAADVAIGLTETAIWR